MARKLRVQFAGGIYHVTFRGNGRQDIFGDDRDRLRLRRRLEEAVEDFGVRLHLYCFMTNHVHLLVETPAGNLSRFMAGVLTGYTVYFNRRHDRVGHLTQGRYGARVVAGDEYLLKLSRYVHLNPVQVKGWKQRPLADRKQRLRDYGWSSYPAYAGLVERPEWLTCAAVWALVPGRGERAQRYRRYVEDGLHRPDVEIAQAVQASPLAIGSVEFQAQVQQAHEQQAAKMRREDVSFRQLRMPEAPDAVLEEVAGALRVPAAELRRKRRDGLGRAVAALALLRRCGLTQREVAEWLQIGSGSAVSYLLRMLRARAEREAPTSRLVGRLTKRSVNSHLQG
jgi:REP element-mobilizing transposase RayT